MSAYSERCASFRTHRCITSSLAGDVFGNNQRTNGPMIREVLVAENSSEEANEMNAIHAISGSQRLRNLASDWFCIEPRPLDFDLWPLTFDKLKLLHPGEGQRPKAFLLESRRSRDDFNNLVRDCSLADSIHVQCKTVDQFTRVLRCRIHRCHSGSLFRGYRFKHRPEHLCLN